MHTQSIAGGIFLAVVLLAVAVVINAAAGGQIKGIVTDGNTGDPIVGASVQVVDAAFEATTDSHGDFVIKRLQPGVYTLRASHRDYQTVAVVDVQVDSDRTTVVNVQLFRKATGPDSSASVSGNGGIIDKTKVEKRAAASSETIEKAPAGSVEATLRQSAGVATDEQGNDYVRGGRAGDVASSTEGSSSGKITADLRPGQVRQPSESELRDHDRLWRVPEPVPEPDGTVRCPMPPRPPYPDWDEYEYDEAYRRYPFDAMYFRDYGFNPYVDTRYDCQSTFAIDVDDASFVLTRSYLDRGVLPPSDAVRVEEFVNHFRYNYPQPQNRAFAITVEGALSPWDRDCHLLKIGIQGQEVTRRERKPANLVFVVDVSGSMQRENRLELVKDGLRMLINSLKRDDMVGIVIYGTSARELLPPTPVNRRDRILQAIDQMRPGGSTYAEAGIETGYRMAAGCFDPERINRLILCSDGVANVGRTGPEEILREVRRYVDMGITLTAVGVGMGNYNDVLLEQLANRGNGQYAYIDDRQEARRFFVDNLTGVLQEIARDVKIQVEFDPATVAYYRLLGYENRDVADNAFRDDRVDGGEIGAGHQVTALYEIVLKRQRPGAGLNLGKVQVRYKDLDHGEVIEVQKAIERGVFGRNWTGCSDDFKLAAAAAEFSEILRGSPWTRGTGLDEVIALVREVQEESDNNDVAEFVKMIQETMRHSDELAKW